MSIVTFTPAKTETQVVEVSPATITLTLTLREAHIVRALLGNCSDLGTYKLFTELSNTLEEHDASNCVIMVATFPFKAEMFSKY